MNDIIAVILLSIGVLFNFLGCIGLIRLPDVYNRLQSATKCVTLGTCSILLGLLVLYGFNDIGLKALISIPLLFFSATVAAHALVRGAYLSGVKLDERTVVDHYKAVRDGIVQESSEKDGREEEIYEVS
jgi:multicomponent Na+:H+ antiporter subunit G